MQVSLLLTLHRGLVDHHSRILLRISFNFQSFFSKKPIHLYLVVTAVVCWDWEHLVILSFKRGRGGEGRIKKVLGSILHFAANRRGSSAWWSISSSGKNDIRYESSQPLYHATTSPGRHRVLAIPPNWLQCTGDGKSFHSPIYNIQFAEDQNAPSHWLTGWKLTFQRHNGPRLLSP